MNITKYPSFILSNLADLRKLIAISRANNEKYSWVRLVDTQSMSPSFDGDINLLVEWSNPYTFRNGDLIVVSKPNLPFLLVHRACGYRLEKNERQVLQIADHFISRNEISASWVNLDSILGKIVQIRYGANKQVVALDSVFLQKLSFQIARLSMRKYTLIINEDYTKKFFLSLYFVTLNHRIFCYLFRFALFLNAHLIKTFKSSQMD